MRLKFGYNSFVCGCCKKTKIDNIDIDLIFEVGMYEIDDIWPLKYY